MADVQLMARDSKRVENVDPIFQQKSAGDPGRIATGRVATEDRAATSPASRDIQRQPGARNELGRSFGAGYFATSGLVGTRFEDTLADALAWRAWNGKSAQDLRTDGDKFGARMVPNKLKNLCRKRNRAAMPAARLAQ